MTTLTNPELTVVLLQEIFQHLADEDFYVETDSLQPHPFVDNSGIADIPDDQKAAITEELEDAGQTFAKFVKKFDKAMAKATYRNRVDNNWVLDSDNFEDLVIPDYEFDIKNGKQFSTKDGSLAKHIAYSTCGQNIVCNLWDENERDNLSIDFEEFAEKLDIPDSYWGGALEEILDGNLVYEGEITAESKAKLAKAIQDYFDTHDVE